MCILLECNLTQVTQWRRHWDGYGWVRTPTSVHTPPEIRVNPLRSVLFMGVGVPCMYIVTCSVFKSRSFQYTVVIDRLYSHNRPHTRWQPASSKLSGISWHFEIWLIQRWPPTYGRKSWAICDNKRAGRSFLVGETWSDYLDRMEQPETFGDHITLTAVAEMYDVQIVILSTSGLSYTTLISAEPEFRYDRSYIVIGHDPIGLHYVSLEVINSDHRTMTQIIHSEGS